MKYIFVVAVAIFVVVFVTDSQAFAATECYGISGSTRQEAGGVLGDAQTYIPSVAAPITSVAVNLYQGVSGTRNVNFQFFETTGGKPTVRVIGTGIYTLPVSGLPTTTGVGNSQAFICGAIPTTQTFIISPPVSLDVGTEYAFMVTVQSSGTGSAFFGYVEDFPTIAPGIGQSCSGLGVCTTWTEWLNNGDMVYSIDNSIIVDDSSNRKIDDQIDDLRNFLRLGNNVGGLVFGMVIISVVFIFGLLNGIPFLVLALFNSVLIGAFSKAGIIPPWILIALIAVGGVAIVIKLGSGGGSDSNEI